MLKRVLGPLAQEAKEEPFHPSHVLTNGKWGRECPEFETRQVLCAFRLWSYLCPFL